MKVTVIKYDLEYQPGFVLFEFKDIKNKTWSICEKLPVVGLPYPTDVTHVPFTFSAPSRILETSIDENKKEVLKIEFLHHIEANDSETIFEVFSTDYQ